MTSTLRQLLEEISWEGNASKYRGGGLGKENVLTAEVFQALDFLPRSRFLGAVLDDAQEATPGRAPLSAHAEQMTVTVLPGDLTAEELAVRVQPDVLVSSPGDFIVVEAKAIRRATFQIEQLAREMLIAQTHAAGRRPVVLLVLDKPPPINVREVGQLSIAEAIDVGMQRITGRVPTVPAVDVEVLWTTWASIASQVEQSLSSFVNPDPSVIASVQRVGGALSEAIEAHG